MPIYDKFERNIYVDINGNCVPVHEVILASKEASYFDRGAVMDYLISVAVNQEVFAALKEGGYLLSEEQGRAFAKSVGFSSELGLGRSYGVFDSFEKVIKNLAPLKAEEIKI